MQQWKRSLRVYSTEKLGESGSPLCADQLSRRRMVWDVPVDRHSVAACARVLSHGHGAECQDQSYKLSARINPINKDVFTSCSPRLSHLGVVLRLRVEILPGVNNSGKQWTLVICGIHGPLRDRVGFQGEGWKANSTR